MLSAIRDGKEQRFEELEEVWSHAHDRDEFVQYVAKVLRTFMKEEEKA